MTQISSPDLRTRPDGSIDTAFYMAKGRVQRSRQFHSLVKNTPTPGEKSTASLPGGWVARLFGQRPLMAN